jgi:hypothetical protein
MLLWSYAKLKIVERKLISAASEEVLKRISPEAGGALRAQHLANFAWAFAKMRSDRSDPSDPSDLDPSEVVMRLAVLALQRAEELKPLELASLVWALAQSNGASTASTRLAMHLTKEASTRRMKPQEPKIIAMGSWNFMYVSYMSPMKSVLATHANGLQSGKPIS